MHDHARHNFRLLRRRYREPREEGAHQGVLEAAAEPGEEIEHVAEVGHGDGLGGFSALGTAHHDHAAFLGQAGLRDALRVEASVRDAFVAVGLCEGPVPVDDLEGCGEGAPGEVVGVDGQARHATGAVGGEDEFLVEDVGGPGVRGDEGEGGLVRVPGEGDGADGGGGEGGLHGFEFVAQLFVEMGGPVGAGLGAEPGGAALVADVSDVGAVAGAASL